MDQLDRAPLFTALTRPQMFAGVTYSYFIINAVIAAELFLVFRSIWVLPMALVIHGFGVLLCLREPRIIADPHPSPASELHPSGRPVPKLGVARRSGL